MRLGHAHLNRGSEADALDVLGTQLGTEDFIPKVAEKEFKQILVTSRGILARARFSHVRQSVRFLGLAKRKNLLGLARAPPQGKLPPQPDQIAAVVSTVTPLLQAVRFLMIC